MTGAAPPDALADLPAAPEETLLGHELDADEPPADTSVRCWAADGAGGAVGDVPLDTALELFEACRRAASAADASAPLVWIDVACPGPPEAALLRERLRFHPLAVEDCLRGRQRPKLDRYPGYFFLVLYAAAVNPERERMALHEVHVFLGRRYMVTVHDHPVPELGELLARWKADPAAVSSVGVLAHGVLDAVVDRYFPVLDHFADQVEDAEAAIFEGRPHREGLEHLIRMRREMTIFRKVLGPERDLVSTLLRRDLPFLAGELSLYYQDVHDHLLRAVEELDTLRDLLTGAMEAQLSVTSNQLNVTMRLMTSWSIILMAMALISGIYGMNFRWMPELGLRWGYPGALVLMGVVGAALFAYFRRRCWI
jgi:magnesium transporter